MLIPIGKLHRSIFKIKKKQSLQSKKVHKQSVFLFTFYKSSQNLQPTNSNKKNPPKSRPSP